MEKQDKKEDFFAQWGEFQKAFYSSWADSYGKIYQPWLDALESWQKMKPPFGAPDLFSKWREMVQETIGKAAEQAQVGLGPDVFSRVLRASNVFVVFNEFWLEVLKDLPELYQVKSDEVKSRAIFERWVMRYKKVFEQLMGAPPSDSAQEMMNSWLNILQSHQAAASMMGAPWIQAMPQWRDQAASFMKGDWSALARGRSLWREVYDETLGRVFRMPAFGLTKEQTERLRRTYDAFAHYWGALPNFYQYFYDTGMEALKEVFDKVQNLKPDELKPETMRDVYRIWWTTNENAHFDLFKRPEFGNAMSEVLNYGLKLKQRLDELTAEWCEAVSIPSNREFDEVARAVQELRRTVRNQQKTIDALKRKLETTE